MLHPHQQEDQITIVHRSEKKKVRFEPKKSKGRETIVMMNEGQLSI